MAAKTVVLMSVPCGILERVRDAGASLRVLSAYCASLDFDLGRPRGGMIGLYVVADSFGGSCEASSCEVSIVVMESGKSLMLTPRPRLFSAENGDGGGIFPRIAVTGVVKPTSSFI